VGPDSGWSHAAKGQAFVITNMTLRRILALAYDIPVQVQRFRLVGGPNEVLSARFDIHAKIPEGVATDRLFAMLRARHFFLREGASYDGTNEFS
jgi:uncharacterized protein (TIGR03435 family)